MMLAYAPDTVFCLDSVQEKRFHIIGCIPVAPLTMLYRSDMLVEGVELQPGYPRIEYLYSGGVYHAQIAHRCSPYDYITDSSVPTLFVHGTADQLLRHENSCLAYAKGRGLGVAFDIILVQGETIVWSRQTTGKVAIQTFCQWSRPLPSG